MAPLIQALAKWRNVQRGLECIGYALKHQYTGAGLRLSKLKGEDYYCARHVVDACHQAGGFCVLLASMEKIVTFPNDVGGEDYKTSELLLTDVRDLEGFTLSKSLVISEDVLLDQGLYDSRDYDHRHGGEYMGNQHAEIDHIYNNTVGAQGNVNSFISLTLARSCLSFERIQ